MKKHTVEKIVMMTRPAIGQEFKSQLKELESEDMIRKQKDELKSQALIRKIQQQDKLKTDQSDSQTEEVTTQVRRLAKEFGKHLEILRFYRMALKICQWH